MPSRLNEENEKRLRAIVDNTMDGLVTVGTDGRVQHFNKACEKIFGYPANEVIGRNVTLIMPAGAATTPGTGLEIEGRRKNGSMVHLALTVTPISLDDKSVIYSIVLRDSTDRKQAERERENLIKKLAATNKDLEQFATIVAHDLKAPLRAITQHLQIVDLNNKGKLDADSETSIQFAVDGATRMRKLIDALFDYAKFGFRETVCVPLDGNEILKTVCLNLETEIREKGAAITNDPLPYVQGDAVQIQQLLQNLVGNALKYCTSAPVIHISARPENDAWIFAVKDNGIGIPPAQKERIFNIFCRLHSGEEYQGTGVGLAICDRVVKNHHGRIWVESTPGAGATFYFTLPAADAPAQKMAANG